MLLSDLPELINIINEIIPDDDPDDQVIFFESEENESAFIETCLQLMYDYVDDNPSAISEPDFEENMIDNIKELFSNNLLSEDAEEEIDEAIAFAESSPEPNISTITQGVDSGKLGIQL